MCESTGSYSPGDLVQVFHRGRVYDAKVVDVVEGRLRAHYVGWKARWDEWLEADSERVVVPAAEGDEIEDSISDSERVIDQALESIAKKRYREESEEDVVLLSQSKRPSIQLDKQPLNAGAGSEVDSCNVVRDDSDAVCHSASQSPGRGEDSSPVPLLGLSAEQAAVGPQSAAMLSVRGCAQCKTQVSGRGISCGKCRKLFHAETACLGVSECVVGALLEATDGSVHYMCCSCRFRVEGLGGSESGDALSQMLCIIGDLAARVRGLSDDMAAIHRMCPPGDLSGSQPEEGSSRPSSVVDEVREVMEREKRKSSIILRGLGSLPVDQVQQAFDGICQYLGLESAVLVDVIKVNDNTYRAKIVDHRHRLGILASARNLRNSTDYRRVFVQRDLTYAQRSEVIARRVSRRGAGSASAPSTAEGSILSGANSCPLGDQVSAPRRHSGAAPVGLVRGTSSLGDSLGAGVRSGVFEAASAGGSGCVSRGGGLVAGAGGDDSGRGSYGRGRQRGRPRGGGRGGGSSRGVGGVNRGGAFNVNHIRQPNC